MINLQTLKKNAYNFVACTIYIKKKEVADVSKIRKRYFFAHQQDLQNFPLLDISKS